MGDIVGGLIGGVGSLFGGSQASGQALKGFNYLKDNTANQAAQGEVAPAIANQNVALTQQGGAVGQEGRLAGTASDLLTGSATQGEGNAFKNYLGSTGYNFQKQQGVNAITGSAAARGILNSGGTAKALASFGNNLAATGFNNYLGQLNTAGQGYGNTASGYASNAGGYGSQVTTGVGAANNVGQAGTEGGQTASKATAGGDSGFFGSLAGIATALI